MFGVRGKQVSLATRCSVHCKSDATHKLNKGECRAEDVALSLMSELAKKVCKMIESAQWPTRTIAVAGGLALNGPFMDILREHLRDSEIRVFEESPYFEAFGASLFASQIPKERGTPERDNRIRPTRLAFDVLPALKDAEPLLDYRGKTKR